MILKNKNELANKYIDFMLNILEMDYIIKSLETYMHKQHWNLHNKHLHLHNVPLFHH